MKISFKLDSVGIKLKRNTIVKLKCIAQNAMQFITCGHKQAICGEFKCLEEVRVTELTDSQRG